MQEDIFKRTEEQILFIIVLRTMFFPILKKWMFYVLFYVEMFDDLKNRKQMFQKKNMTKKKRPETM